MATQIINTFPSLSKIQCKSVACSQKKWTFEFYVKKKKKTGLSSRPRPTPSHPTTPSSCISYWPFQDDSSVAGLRCLCVCGLYVAFFLSLFCLYFLLLLPSKYTTSQQRRCNVVTLQRRYNDVPATFCVCWVVPREGCVSWLWNFLGIFTYIFFHSNKQYKAGLVAFWQLFLLSETTRQPFCN